MTRHFGTNLEKYCSDGQYEQLFFKYFPIHVLVFEKMDADGVVCSSQCRLLNLTTYFGTNLEKHCSDGQYEELFFKYFPIHVLVFDKMCTEDVVCRKCVACSNNVLL
jgi:hypothetical protein